MRIFFSSYEPEQSSAFIRTIKPGQTIFDVGAHVGYYSLLSSVLTGPAGRVVAFEPEPVNSYYLKKHLELNHCANASVVCSAVADRAGTGVLARGTGSGTWRLAEVGEHRVTLTTLDEQCHTLGLHPGLIKIDVEGAEAAVLRGARETLVGDKPIIFLSTHGPQAHQESCGFLSGLGYQLEALIGRDPKVSSELVCTPFL